LFDVLALGRATDTTCTSDPGHSAATTGTPSPGHSADPSRAPAPTFAILITAAHHEREAQRECQPQSESATHGNPRFDPGREKVICNVGSLGGAGPYVIVSSRAETTRRFCVWDVRAQRVRWLRLQLKPADVDIESPRSATTLVESD
jgi:hypothetical protein